MIIVTLCGISGTIDQKKLHPTIHLVFDQCEVVNVNGKGQGKTTLFVRYSWEKKIFNYTIHIFLFNLACEITQD